MATSSRHKMDDENLTCQRCRQVGLIAFPGHTSTFSFPLVSCPPFALFTALMRKIPHQPLILDLSIANISPSTHSLITSALPSSSPSSTLPPSTKLAQLPPSSRASAKIWADAQESFILLSDSTLVPPAISGTTHTSRQTPISTTTRHTLAANLHALLSSKTPIDHPLCTECTTLLQSGLQKQLEELSRERDAYIAFERDILRNREDLTGGRKKSSGKEEEGLGESDIEGTQDEWESFVRRKKELESEEERLRKVLEEKERELDGVRAEEERVKREEEEVEREEGE